MQTSSSIFGFYQLVIRGVLAVTSSFFLFVFPVSCGSPKADIVDRQRAILDSIKHYKTLAFEEETATYSRVHDSLQQAPLNEQLKQKAVAYDQLSRSESFRLYQEKQIVFQKEYDSLEFELKKY